MMTQLRTFVVRKASLYRVYPPVTHKIKYSPQPPPFNVRPYFDNFGKFQRDGWLSREMAGWISREMDG